jgi:protoheme IX farnesyltransferase
MIAVKEILSRELISSKLKDYVQLMKIRLTSTVILSSAFGYLIGISATPYTFDATVFIALLVGGFLVVSSSNGLNQVIEKDYDKLMKRTENRPVATGRMKVSEAVIFCTISGLLGVLILGWYLNQLSAWLGLFALISYAFLYTPLKRVSPIAVLVGAFPGAVAPLLGWVAATGSYSMGGGLLFAIQFFWQFPHFWAIAWVLHEDYKRAGYMLLPSKGGKDVRSGLQTVVYTVIVFIVSLTPILTGMISIWSLLVLIPVNVYFLMKSLKLFKSLNEADAKALMFASFIYLPVVQLAILLFS